MAEDVETVRKALKLGRPACWAILCGVLAQAYRVSTQQSLAFDPGVYFRQH